MERWPSWSAPLLGGFGGGLAGLALTGERAFPIAPVYAALGGTALGVLAGLVVWLQGKYKPAGDSPPPVVAQSTGSAVSSRWGGFLLTVAGIGCLVANHVSAVAGNEKRFPLVFGGSMFLAIGLAGLCCPSILTGKATGRRVPWWGHALGGILAVGGLALGMYLWLVVY